MRRESRKGDSQRHGRHRRLRRRLKCRRRRCSEQSRPLRHQRLPECRVGPGRPQGCTAPSPPSEPEAVPGGAVVDAAGCPGRRCPRGRFPCTDRRSRDCWNGARPEEDAARDAASSTRQRLCCDGGRAVREEQHPSAISRRLQVRWIGVVAQWLASTCCGVRPRNWPRAYGCCGVGACRPRRGSR